MDLKPILACVISLLCFCSTVFGHQVRIATYSTDSLLSGVLYNDHILEKRSNVSSVLACALLCRQNLQCLSMSYSVDEGNCQTFGIVYCTPSQGYPSSGVNYYIIGFKDPQPRSIYLKCKATKQSSTMLLGVSSMATDGLWEAVNVLIPCAQTFLQMRPWWYVDLGKTHIIYKIKLLNSILAVLGINKLMLSVGEDLQSMKQCGYHANTIPAAKNGTIICDPPTNGRFVRITMDKFGTLTICEIAIYGELVHD